MKAWVITLLLGGVLVARWGEARVLQPREPGLPLAGPNWGEAHRRGARAGEIPREEEIHANHQASEEKVCLQTDVVMEAFSEVLTEFNVTCPATVTAGGDSLTCDDVYNVCSDIISHLGLALVNDSCPVGTKECPKTSSAKAYGYGFLMVLLVSAASLLGVFVVPIKKKLPTVYRYVNALMIAMGVSALFVDAILHLIPHAIGLHGHEDSGCAGSVEEGHAHEGEEEDITFLWKLCALIAGLYIFFMLEMLLHSFGHSHGEGGGHNIFDQDENHPIRHVVVPHNQCQEVGQGVLLHPGEKDKEVAETTIASNQSSPDHLQSLQLVGNETSEKGGSGKEKMAQQTILCRVRNFFAGIKTIAWFIIIGDGVHNFADGLVLGAAISQSLALGLSTMIALIFHEVPHELGDYVILLSSGLTWYSALIFNLFAAITAVLGFFIGVAAGTSSEVANEWILAVAGGLFIYIALVDLLPQLIHAKDRGWARLGMVLMANIGFLISFVALLLIAIYEDDLNNLF